MTERSLDTDTTDRNDWHPGRDDYETAQRSGARPTLCGKALRYVRRATRSCAGHAKEVGAMLSKTRVNPGMRRELLRILRNGKREQARLRRISAVLDQRLQSRSKLKRKEHQT
jgi:hypothetical protein